jgi:nitrosocyanin
MESNSETQAPSDAGAAGGTRLEGSGEDMGPAGEVVGVKTVEVEAGSFYYKPNTITVKKGEKVKIVMKSVDMMHDFNIDELGVKVPITKSGSTATAEFTADKVGTFEYYCSVGQHRANGQVGTLVVTE